MEERRKMVHVWEKVEVVLEASKSYENPYRDVDVWIDLKGPSFEKRVYGFWDGGNVFRIRFVAPEPGEWRWVSGSNQQDSGLNGRAGSFVAIEWTEEEKQENPCRRGFLRPTTNGHALEYADGTPCFLLGDAWWAAATFRFRWYEDEMERPIGPEMGFKDMVKFRKKQGFNAIALIAALPNWANDGHLHFIRMNDGTGVRDAWRHGDTVYAKDVHNEGGRPFLFPGRVPGYENVFPDVTRINPRYFQYLDRKIDYLNAQGFIPFIEAARRDCSECWKKFYDWPESYARYIQYVFARYQANNCILSPIHFDWHALTIPSREFNEPANLVIEKYGPPPFGNLVSANSSPSTLVNFGTPREAKWLSLHQIGNWREHDYYWHLTEIFYSTPTLPALNGEPYYPGFPNDDPPATSEEANLNCRSSMYGGFLSGAFAGYFYGAQGLWGGDIEEGARYRMWEAIQFESANQVRHLLAFVTIEGLRYRDLEPIADLVTPNKAGNPFGYRGWAFCARTKERDFFLVYFEKDCPQTVIRGAIPYAAYLARWFDPERGRWFSADPARVEADMIGRIKVPPYPSSGKDWGFALTLLRQ